MSVSRVEANKPNTKARLLTSFGVGAVVGSSAMATRKAWLFKDAPSDVFVKKVSKNLEKQVPAHEHAEAVMINNFVKNAVDPEVNVQTLKPHILASKELSEAIKSHPAEDVKVAIERVFSETDDAKLRESLINLQSKTKSDKKFGHNVALKLVHENFDAENKVLKQSKNTSDDVFKMLTSTAKKIQVKSAVIGGLVVAGVATAMMIVFTNTLPNSSTKK